MRKKIFNSVFGIGLGLTTFFGGCSLPDSYKVFRNEEPRKEMRECLEKNNNLERKINEQEDKSKTSEQSEKKDEKIEKDNREKEKFFKPYLGFNALELAIARNEGIDESYERTRLYAEVGSKLGHVNLNYSSLNDIDDLKHETYFGRHIPGIGLREGNQFIVGVIKTSDKEMLDAKVGARDKWLMQKIGDYGYADVSFDGNAGNITLLYGKELGKGFCLEIYNDTEFSFSEKPIQYNELHLGKEVVKNITLFGRAEFWDFSLEKGIYMIGIRANLSQ